MKNIYKFMKENNIEVMYADLEKINGVCIHDNEIKVILLANRIKEDKNELKKVLQELVPCFQIKSVV
jgi:deoxyribose-phosphate aldolase